MKPFVKTVAASTLLVLSLSSTPALAAKIGVTMSAFDDNFLTVLRNGMGKYAESQKDVSLQFEDAQGDVGKQLNQIQNFIAQKVDAIIVNVVDTDATPKMTKLATQAGIHWSTSTACRLTRRCLKRSPTSARTKLTQARCR